MGLRAAKRRIAPTFQVGVHRAKRRFFFFSFRSPRRRTCLAGLIAVCHGRSCPAVPQPTPQRTAGQDRPWHTVGGHAKHVRGDLREKEAEGDGWRPHPGPQGRGYQRPRPMNRPDPPRLSPGANGHHGYGGNLPEAGTSRDRGPGRQQTTAGTCPRQAGREAATGNRERHCGLRISDCGLRNEKGWLQVLPGCAAFFRRSYSLQPGACSLSCEALAAI